MPIEYERILEILYEYWLSEPDELVVRVRMDFLKADGQCQKKEIWWNNPRYKVDDPQKDMPKPVDYKEWCEAHFALADLEKKYPVLKDPFDEIDYKKYKEKT